MPTFNPFREHFPVTYKIIFRTCRERVQVCLGSERTTDGTGGTRTDASIEKHDDAMHMMTWQDATRKRMTRQQQRITGGHLAHRSRGVTTLHHYERISSWDLEWHRREKRKKKRRGKTKLFLWQMSETKEPCEVEQIREKNTTKGNKVENTPLEKRDKEHCEKPWGWRARYILKPLRLSQDREGLRMI